MRILPAAPTVLVLALATGAGARAETPPTLRDITSVRAAGMAGASVGYAGDTDAIHVNPAAISSFEHFNLGVIGFIDYPQQHYLIGVEAVDSKINSDESFNISGGLSYVYYTSGRRFDAHKAHVAQLALSAPIYPKTLFIGLTTRYLHMAGGVVSNSVTIDASAMLSLIKLINVTFAGYNLISVNSTIEAPRGFAAGLSVGKEGLFHVNADLRFDEDQHSTYQPTFKVGAEYLIVNIVAPRVGYAEDRFRNAHLLCAGVSVHIEGWAIEVAYQHAINGDERNIGIAVRLLDI